MSDIAENAASSETSVEERQQSERSPVEEKKPDVSARPLAFPKFALFAAVMVLIAVVVAYAGFIPVRNASIEFSNIPDAAYHSDAPAFSTNYLSVLIGSVNDLVPGAAIYDASRFLFGNFLVMCAMLALEIFVSIKSYAGMKSSGVLSRPGLRRATIVLIVVMLCVTLGIPIGTTYIHAGHIGMAPVALCDWMLLFVG